MLDIVVAVATRLEGDGIPREIAGRSIAVVETGVGLVSAAIALTRFLDAHPARVVMACGVGGAYPGSGVEVGEVVCASTETYGDIGAESPDGFLDLAQLGLARSSEPMPLDCFPVARRVPFVTCAMVTGTDARARSIVARTGGAIESMEGAAIVQAARTFGVRVGEVRGVSNRAGERDRASWRLDEAAAAARQALLAWLEEAPC